MPSIVPKPFSSTASPVPGGDAAVMPSVTSNQLAATPNAEEVPPCQE